MGMPVDKFTDLAYEGLVSGKDQVTIGGFGDPKQFNELVEKRRELFDKLSDMIKSHS